jgi:ubiquinone/menaquinone biosynthesis C-methylase UbiE
VELRSGALESLPLEDGELDAAVMSLVLHYVPEPVAWHWRKRARVCGRAAGWWWWT